MADENEATRLKDLGNSRFKARKFSEAATFYKQAEQLDPGDPVFASNLSAALFEIADYEGCFRAIVRSWAALCAAKNETPSGTLPLRLSTRLAKTMTNGIVTGALSDAMGEVEGGPQAVASLREQSDVCIDASAEARSQASKAWQDWDIVFAESMRVGEAEKRRAQVDIARLPVTKRYFEGAIMEYFMMGHDDLFSIVDGYGPEIKAPLKLDEIPEEMLSKLAFFFGGVGDARHVYASMIGLDRAFGKLSASKRDVAKGHLTLSDVHPTVICRDLLVLMLLHRLVQGQLSSEEEYGVKIALHYVFCLHLIPNAGLKWVTEAIGDLRKMLSETPPSTPDWLYIPEDAAPQLMVILDAWDPWPASRTAEDIITIAHYQPNPDNQDENQSRMPRLGTVTKLQRQIKQDSVEKLQDISASKRESRNRVPEEVSTPQRVIEDLWYSVTDTFVPPKDILDQLPATSRLWKYINAAKPVKQPRRSLETMIDAVFKETFENYGANRTFFDPISCKTPRLNFGGWTYIQEDDYLQYSVRYLEKANTRFRLKPSPVCQDDAAAAAFGTSCTFFEAVAKAWKELQGKLTFDILLGDMNSQLALTRTSASRRPEHIPCKYTRMWLSNVPDYTHGIMNQIICALPSLQEHRQAEIASNCLLHTGSFMLDPNAYCYTYALLHPKEVPTYLNCAVRELRPFGAERIGWNSEERKLKFESIPPREDVIRWLTRLLMNIVWPVDASRPQQMTLMGSGVRHTMNLNAFVILLLHLPTIGYPAHWLSDFAQSLLSNNVWSDADFFEGPLPIPTHYSTKRVPNRRLWLAPWITELSTILSLAAPILPFPLTLASSTDASAFFEADPRVTWDMLDRIYSMAENDTPNMHLMFLHPSAMLHHAKYIRNMRALLDGSDRPPASQLAILTSPEVVDCVNNVVRWRMLVKDFKKMYDEKWTLVLYRFDCNVSVGKPMPVGSWTKAEDIRSASL
ncbi:hypothetical protein PENSPDRAFT_648877 [Peniophora sp. CONT]|nr:hypothetical protein PENSPDRAFT_648877 [Peniophora sp. CONT]